MAAFFWNHLPDQKVGTLFGLIENLGQIEPEDPNAYDDDATKHQHRHQKGGITFRQGSHHVEHQEFDGQKQTNKEDDKTDSHHDGQR